MDFTSFPILRLASLFVRYVSGPITETVKSTAIKQPVFRKYVCVPSAQLYNWCEIKIRLWGSDLEKQEIQKLPEKQAIDLGAKLIGEMTIFILASTLLISEIQRKSRKEEIKEELVSNEKKEMILAIHDLYRQYEQQDEKIKTIKVSLERVLKKLKQISDQPSDTEK